MNRNRGMGDKNTQGWGNEALGTWGKKEKIKKGKKKTVICRNRMKTMPGVKTRIWKISNR